MKNISRFTSTNSLQSNKYPILVTVTFFGILFFLAFFQHLYWYEYDGIYFLHSGKQILDGYGKNVSLVDAPPGGPVLFATLNSVFHDGFVTIKLISLLSGTGIVFFSYYIIRNIFNSKIALLGQLFFAFNSRLDVQSIKALNELLPIFLISVSLYFITKKNLKLSDVIVTGTLLGGAFMIRYQALPVIVAIIIFLLIRNRQIRINALCGALAVAFFIIAASPMFIYNYMTHETILYSNPNSFTLFTAKYQTPEWREKIMQSVTTETSLSIFTELDLFLKNYFHNLFYYGPGAIFNFNTNFNSSLIPPIPFLGIIPVFGGLICCLKLKPNKTNLLTVAVISITTIILVLTIGDITVHFFAIVIIPLIALGIVNLRNVEKNLLPLLVLPVVYFVIMAIVPIGNPDHLFSMWITVPTLGAVFFIQLIPKLLSKIKSSTELTRGVKIITIVLISLVLLANLGFSYKSLKMTIYEDTYEDIKTEFYKLFQKQELQMRGIELKAIGDILSKQPGIENSYVMTSSVSYAYYANSKFVFAYFQEGVKGDSINKFITRENWSAFDLYISNLNSWPPIKNQDFKPIPDYIIYEEIPSLFINQWYIETHQYSDLKILSNPNDPKIPSNFELLYKSNKTGTVVYKINHENQMK